MRRGGGGGVRGRGSSRKRGGEKGGEATRDGERSRGSESTRCRLCAESADTGGCLDNRPTSEGRSENLEHEANSVVWKLKDVQEF